jgi:hypothetical protein
MCGFIPKTMIGDRTAANHGNAHGVGIIGHRRIKVLMSFSAQARLWTRSHLASPRYTPRPGRNSQSAPWG